MRYLEVRRHTMRTRPGKHLSQDGVTLARAVGEGIGPFDRVVTSTLARAFETAIAMGFAVDSRVEALAILGDGVEEEVDWTRGFPAWSRALGRDGAAAAAMRRQAAAWREIVASMPEGGSVLAISHGGIIEAGAVGCLPDADHAAWGRALDYCEGVRLAFDGARFVEARILRLDRAAPIDDRVRGQESGIGGQ
jgi:broad specificity phosphatase PhoE